MQGYHFFAEMPEEWKSKSGCKAHNPFTRATIRQAMAFGQKRNCIAVLTGEEHRMPGGERECLSATFHHLDSDTSFGSVSREYLRKRCVRIPAAWVEKLHPMLWRRVTSD